MGEKEKAIQYLVDLGILLRFDDNLELYHGRARMDNESGEWQVQTNFNNAGNTTANKNINNIATLYTSDKATAQKFAEARSYRRGGSSEIHRIISKDKDALIFNRQFDMNSLNSDQKKRVKAALKDMQHYSLSSSIDIKFEHRNICLEIGRALTNYTLTARISVINDSIVEQMFRHFYPKFGKVQGLHDLIHDMAGAINARFLVTHYPQLAVRSFVTQESSFQVQGENSPCALNLDYIASWLSNNHIVGEKVGVSSATLQDNITTFSLFDVDKVNTQKAIGDRYMSMLNQFGGIGRIVGNISSDRAVMKAMSSDDPKQVVSFVRKFVGFDTLIDTQAGVWEGFTIAEHTETVLRVFEKTFADDVPNTILPFMRLAILSHDLGKGWAKKNGIDEHQYTAEVCKTLYENMEIPQNIQQLLQFVIGESQIYTTALYVKKDKYASVRLEQRCSEVLREAFGKNPQKDIVSGFCAMCRMLQTCDSAAYTRYGITRDSKTGIYYRNANDRFTKGFVVPSDLTHQKMRFKEDDDLFL